MNIQDFDIENKKIKLYEIQNKNGNSLSITNYGAALINVKIKDKDNIYRDVVLSHDQISTYKRSNANFGGTIGRVSNRIKGGSLIIDNKKYQMELNDGDNTLHSGKNFYNKRVWETVSALDDSVTFYLYSKDMDQNLPGNLSIYTTYTFNDDDELIISYKYKSDKDTIVSLCNHSYFNLSGDLESDILTHKIHLNCDYITEIDSDLIPTGKFVKVDGTPFDFKEEKEIGRDIKSSFKYLKYAGGYDHNYVINDDFKIEKHGNILKNAGYIFSDKTGIRMDIYTTLPGLQLYTSNTMKDEIGKNNTIYGNYAGACFETQYFPDSIHNENFPSTLVRKNEEKLEQTIYKFSLK